MGVSQADTFTQEMACAKALSTIISSDEEAQFLETKNGNLLFFPEKRFRKNFGALVYSDHSAYKCNLPLAEDDVEHPLLKERSSKFILKIEKTESIPLELRYSSEGNERDIRRLKKTTSQDIKLLEASCSAHTSTVSKTRLINYLSQNLEKQKDTAKNWSGLYTGVKKGNDIRNIYKRKDLKNFILSVQQCQQIPELKTLTQEVLSLLPENPPKADEKPVSQ